MNLNLPKLKKLSGKEVISILNQFGFEVINQRGSYIKLRRTKDNLKQTLLIPNHKEIDTGTLRTIVRQAGKYIPMEDLLNIFIRNRRTGDRLNTSRSKVSEFVKIIIHKLLSLGVGLGTSEKKYRISYFTKIHF